MGYIGVIYKQTYGPFRPIDLFDTFFFKDRIGVFKDQWKLWMCRPWHAPDLSSMMQQFHHRHWLHRASHKANASHLKEHPNWQVTMEIYRNISVFRLIAMLVCQRCWKASKQTTEKKNNIGAMEASGFTRLAKRLDTRSTALAVMMLCGEGFWWKFVSRSQESVSK